MHYYYTGVASWGWFYNYHYAPRISGESTSYSTRRTRRVNLPLPRFHPSSLDLVNVDKMTFNFNYGKPFHPFEQLMGVLPEASKDHIPLAFRVSFLSSFAPALVAR
jgi:5'-3' exoribonuclease 1